MNNFTVLGDSLAIRRIEDNIFEDDLYSSIIGNHFSWLRVLNKARQNNSTDDLISTESIVYALKGSNSIYFSIQSGIVDCSPRIFTKRRRALLGALISYPFFKIFINPYIVWKSRNRFRLTKKVRKTYVSEENYKKNIQKLINIIKTENDVKKIFLINICSPNEYIKNRSYGIENNIIKYNEILNEIFVSENDVELVDLYNYSLENPDAVLPDGQHINKKGHVFIANEIIEFIQKQSKHR